MLKIAATNSWSGFKHSWVDNLDKNSQKKPKTKKKNGKNNNRNHKKTDSTMDNTNLPTTQNNFTNQNPLAVLKNPKCLYKNKKNSTRWGI
jgi:hypothetical protein